MTSLKLLVLQAACVSSYSVQQIASEGTLAQSYILASCPNCSNPELKDQINRLKDTAGSLRQQ